jgi:hypothetical protein
MNKYLQLLYNMKEGGGIIDADECAQINKALSTISIDDIPKDQFVIVKEHLNRLFLMESVEPGTIEPSIIERLEKLLEHLS